MKKKAKAPKNLLLVILNRSILHPRSRRLLNEAALLEFIIITVSIIAFLSFVLTQSILYVLLLVLVLLLAAYNGHLWHVVSSDNKPYARNLFIVTTIVAIITAGWLYAATVRNSQVDVCYDQQSTLDEFNDYNTVLKRNVVTQKCVRDADKNLRNWVTFGFDSGLKQ